MISRVDIQRPLQVGLPELEIVPNSGDRDRSRARQENLPNVVSAQRKKQRRGHTHAKKSDKAYRSSDQSVLEHCVHGRLSDDVPILKG